MIRRECPREADVLEALQASAWPGCAGAELRAHVEGCPACAELVSVVLPLLDEHHAAVSTASVPPSGAVWWRAQMRARQEAARAAARPISIVQAVGLACAIGLLAGGLTLLAPSLSAWFGSMAGLTLPLPSVTWSEIQWLAPATLAVLLAVGMFVAAPVAVYLAVRGD